VGDDQDPPGVARPEQKEPLLLPGVVGIVEDDGAVLEEDRLGLLERDTVSPAERKRANPA